MPQSSDILKLAKASKAEFDAKSSFESTEEEQKIVGEYSEVFAILDGAKSESDQYWPLYRRAYRAIPEYADDGETVMSLNPSTEFQITQAFLSEQHANLPSFDLEPEGEEDVVKIPGLKARVEKVDINDGVIHKFIANSEQAARYGMSVVFVGYSLEKKIITDSTFNEETGKIEENTKSETIGRHFSRVVDMENFWCDNVYDFNDARQCIEEEYITIDEFRTRYMDKNKSTFPYKNCEYVNPDYRNRDYLKSNDDTSGESTDTMGEFVKLTHWYKVPGGDGNGDFYRIIANDNIVIRDTELPYDHKMLPYSWKNFISNELYIWRSVGIPRLIAQCKEMVKLSVDGYFKQAIASTSPEIILRDGVSLEKPLSNMPGAVNRISGGTGNINNDIFERRAGSPDATAMNMADYATREIIQTVGVPYTDITQINVSEKATKAAIRREMQRARQGNFQKEDDKFIERFYTLRIKNIMQFDPLPILEDGEVRYQKDLLRGEYSYITAKGKKLNIKESSKANGIKKESNTGWTSITWTPELIRANVIVKVRTGSNLPVYKEVERQNFNDMFMQLPNLPVIKQSLDQLGYDSEAMIKKFFEINNFPIGMTADKSGSVDTVEEDLARMGLTPPASIPKLTMQNVKRSDKNIKNMEGSQEPQVPGQPQV